MRVVEIEGLKWRYRGSPHYALNGVNLGVEKGEFLAITGLSGAGKTTLVLSILGIIPQRLPGEFSGKVKVLGLSTLSTDVTIIAQRVGVVFEDPEIQFVMGTVEDEVALSLEAMGLPPEEVRERTLWALELVGLGAGFLQRNPSQLSGGEKQRVAIASAVAKEPELLILDEPTSDLDPAGKEEVVSAIESLRRQLDVTIVMVEQEPDIIYRFADRVVVLEKGRVALEGTPRELYHRMEELRRLSLRPPELYELCRAAGLREPSLEELVRLAEKGLLDGSVCGEPRGRRGGLEEVVRVQGVTHVYPGGIRALDNVTLTLYSGELVALMGPNGSGKTTLAKVIAGLVRPTSGRVLVRGRDVSSYGRLELSSIVGYVYQNPQHQLFCQSVYEEVAFGLRLRGAGEGEVRKAVDEALRLFNLEGKAEEHPFFLSKGEKRRLALASVYALNPSVLIVDEPTTGQDRAFSEYLFSTLRRLAEEGKAVVAITHSVDLASAYADRVVVMCGGRIVADGEPDSVLADPGVAEKARIKRPLRYVLCRQSRHG
ncbi:ABC transporter ATP-binding protein [Thermofilum pendens]|uniref:ABC transporter related n=1 Tax=Thermofilum pendens (strain DSM 2475 / Hrk 5) TaxID=368408 RepID=A1RZ74_THEPD|nr:energy-coupling factor transporter ATPase [Thermofilum pendens]ABL78504.1 ABC transporter related [Thermofilum pendens Hrk 5]